MTPLPRAIVDRLVRAIGWSSIIQYGDDDDGRDARVPISGATARDAATTAAGRGSVRAHVRINPEPWQPAMLFHSWTDLIRVVAVGAPAYVALVLLLRISGKRTLSKLNAFDLVITIAMGSTLATILLSAEVSLSEGVAALALLVLLQFLITWTSIRFDRFRRIVKSEPTLLFYGSRYLEETLRRERMTRAEVLAAIRAQGFADLAAVGAVVLETDGSMTAIRLGSGAAPPSTVKGVEGVPPGV